MKYTLLDKCEHEFYTVSFKQKERWILEYFHQELKTGTIAFDKDQLGGRFNDGTVHIVLDYMWKKKLLEHYFGSNNQGPSTYSITKEGIDKLEHPWLYWLNNWHGSTQVLAAIISAFLGAFLGALLTL